MTALSVGSIPSGINTYERLFIWAAQCCQSISNGQEVNVLENQGNQPMVQVQLYRTADRVDRMVVTAYIPYDFALLNDPNQKTWMAAKDISAAAPHVNMLTN